jgi:transposase
VTRHAAQTGVRVVERSEWYSSRRCLVCGAVDESNRDATGARGVTWCVACGHKIPSDWNGALNIAVFRMRASPNKPIRLVLRPRHWGGHRKP